MTTIRIHSFDQHVTTLALHPTDDENDVDVNNDQEERDPDEYISGFFGRCTHVERFEKLNRIGEGTYGIVYRARDTRTNTLVALKKIRLTLDGGRRLPQDGLPLSHFREIHLLLCQLRHPNIVHVLEIATGRDLDAIFTVMEYCEHDIANLVDTMPKPFAPSEIKTLMHQLLEGLAYLHSHFIIHRDLKLSNLLLTGDGTLKIADFGLARAIGIPQGQFKPTAMTPKVVTLWYRAPELLLGEPDYTLAVDLWSVGCIFGEFIQHAPFLPGKTELEQFTLIVQLLGSPSPVLWPALTRLPLYGSFHIPHQPVNHLGSRLPRQTKGTLDLLQRLLTYDPDRRLNVQAALTHSYFSEMPPMKHKSLLPTFPEYRNLQTNKAPKVKEEQQQEKVVEMKVQSVETLTSLAGAAKPLEKRSLGAYMSQKKKNVK